MKEVVKYHTFYRQPSGYAFVETPQVLFHSSVLRFLNKWGEARGVKVISFILSRVEENFEAYRGQEHAVDRPYGGGGPESDRIVGTVDIPYCDFVYYLEIRFEPIIMNNSTDKTIVHQCSDGKWLPCPASKCDKCINMSIGFDIQQICDILNAEACFKKTLAAAKNELGTPFDP